MNWMAWLLRIARWSRRPPSTRQVIRLLVLLAVVGGIAAIEALGFWPEALTLDRGPQAPRLPR
ncbi:MAG: hypothetical protein AAGI13_02525 [Pseudomonadota bacterium]